jgi:hypothetical protein
MIANDQGTYIIMHEGYHNKFSASETMLHEPANEEGLLYFTVYVQFVNVA